jgi:hypothetical protein
MDRQVDLASKVGDLVDLGRGAQGMQDDVGDLQGGAKRKCRNRSRSGPAEPGQGCFHGISLEADACRPHLCIIDGSGLLRQSG